MSFPRRIRRAFNALLGRSYEAAGKGRRAANMTSQPSALSAAHVAHGTIRARSRAATANIAQMKAAMNTIVSGVVGSGIKMQSTIDNPTIVASVHRALDRFVDKIDFDGAADLYGLQAQGVLALARDGEFIAQMIVSDDGRLQLRMIDSDQLDSSATRPLLNGGQIIQGIELDADGRRVAYHLFSKQPAAMLGSVSTVRILADDILHIFERQIAGQQRGIPWAHAVLFSQVVYDQALDAQLERQKIAPMMVGIVTEQAADSGGFSGEPAGDGIFNASLEPGTLQFLSPGQDIKFSEAATIGSEVIDFLKIISNGIASGLGVPAWTITGNISDANFSSMRVGLIEFRRRMEMIQFNIVAFQFLRPIYRRWLTLEVMSGRIEIPGFMEDPERFLGMKAVPPKAAWLDPLKDVKGEILAVDAGLQSRRESVASRGYDVEEIDREIAADNERATRLGLAFGQPPQPLPKLGAVA